MPDLNREALVIWDALKPMIDQEISSKTQGVVQRRKAKVTTAPSMVTNTIGVTEAFGDEIFIPFVSNLASAVVGDFVWIEFMYGASNSFASMFASADTKDQTVAGNLTVNGAIIPTKRMSRANLSSPGWYRILEYNAVALVSAKGSSGHQIDIHIGRNNLSGGNETHFIRCCQIYNNIVFIDEQSASSDFGIDKIRYCYNENTYQAYIDIHYKLSTTNAVWTYFDIYDGLVGVLPLYTSVGLSAVADAPSGETVMTTYTFSANGTGDMTVNGNLTANSTVSGQGFYDLLLGPGTAIPSNDDLNNYTTTGVWYAYLAQAQSASNCPVNTAFKLIVMQLFPVGRYYQILMASGATDIYLRFYNDDTDTFTAWKKLSMTNV